MSHRYDLGMIGLGVMGKSLAANFTRNGYKVVGFDKAQQDTAEIGFDVVSSVEELVEKLVPPRIIMLMVPARKAVNSVINSLLPLIDSGDIIIDGGNSYFEDTRRRVKSFSQKSINFAGVGISGGKQGALWGPSLLIGCDEAVWPTLEPMFLTIAAKADDGEPCAAWLGEDGAGHFVKMVHNGIEYGQMQLIAESYDLLHRGAGLTNEVIGEVFTAWDKGVLSSYLLTITSQILKKKDEITGEPLIEKILDQSEQKGTGKWTSQTSLDLGLAIPTISAAVESRLISSLKIERVRASEILGGSQKFEGDVSRLVFLAETAFFTSMIMLYAQGIQLFQSASGKYGWDLDISQIIRIWRAGCIIRSGLLDYIAWSYQQDPKLQNLVLDDNFRASITDNEPGWREVMKIAVDIGIPMMAHHNSLNYYDSYRSGVLPANLTQAQRDYFGAHTYKRVDMKGIFHTHWE